MRTAEHLTEIGLEELRRWDLYDTGVWIFDDMAATDNPMFSPKTAEEILAPAWGHMVDAFKSAGAAKVIMHSDGNIGPLLDLFIDLGFDGINPVEYKAGLDCIELRERYGERLALIGGLSNGAILPRGDREEIIDHTLRMMSAGKEGGMILGTHSVGHDISIEAWDICFDTYVQYRDYPLDLPEGY
jgi:uroporphyrinogen decarboxylase